MSQTQQAIRLKLDLPEHVSEVLSNWTASEIGCTPEDVLEALADELCVNKQLRAFVAGLAGE